MSIAGGDGMVVGSKGLGSSFGRKLVVYVPDAFSYVRQRSAHSIPWRRKPVLRLVRLVGWY